MAVEPGGLDVDQARALAIPGAFDGVSHRIVDREEVESVDLDTRHSEPVRSGHLRASHRVGGGGRLGIAVVFADEDHGQLPDIRHIVGFEDQPLVRTPVAIEGHGHAVLALGSCGKAGAHRQGARCADNPVCTQHPLVEVRNMHRSALAAANAAGRAIDFIHGFLQIQTAGDALAMSAMGRRNPIPLVQRHVHTGRRCLLPGGQVNEAGNFAVREVFEHAVFEVPRSRHRAIRAQQFVPA